MSNSRTPRLTPRDRLIRRIHRQEEAVLASLAPEVWKAWTRVYLAPRSLGCILHTTVPNYPHPMAVQTSWHRTPTLYWGDGRVAVWSDWTARHHIVCASDSFGELYYTSFPENVPRPLSQRADSSCPDL